MRRFTVEEVRALIDPFIGSTLRSSGPLGRRAFTMHLPETATVIVDDDGDDVAFAAHPTDARLMAAAPQLARQLLDLHFRIDELRQGLVGICEVGDAASEAIAREALGPEAPA